MATGGVNLTVTRVTRVGANFTVKCPVRECGIVQVCSIINLLHAHRHCRAPYQHRAKSLQSGIFCRNSAVSSLPSLRPFNILFLRDSSTKCITITQPSTFENIASFSYFLSAGSCSDESFFYRYDSHWRNVRSKTISSAYRALTSCPDQGFYIDISITQRTEAPLSRTHSNKQGHSPRR